MDGVSETDVLIVEDDDANRDLLARRFARDGLRVATAMTVGEAIGAVRRQRPGLVVLDLSLGAEGGEKVIRALKSDTETWTVPIIVLSGHARARQEEAWRAGCDDYVVKPFDFDALLSRVRSLLPSLEQSRG